MARLNINARIHPWARPTTQHPEPPRTQSSVPSHPTHISPQRSNRRDIPTCSKLASGPVTRSRRTKPLETAKSPETTSSKACQAPQPSTDPDSIAGLILSRLRWNFVPAGSNHRAFVEDALAPYNADLRDDILEKLQVRAAQNDSDIQLQRVLKDLRADYNRKDRCHQKLVELWKTDDYIPQQYRPSLLSRDLLQELWMLSREAREQNQLSCLWGPDEQVGILSSQLRRTGEVQNLSVSTVKKARQLLKESKDECAVELANVHPPREVGPGVLGRIDEEIRDARSNSPSYQISEHEGLNDMIEASHESLETGAIMRHTGNEKGETAHLLNQTTIARQPRTPESDRSSRSIEHGRRAPLEPSVYSSVFPSPLAYDPSASLPDSNEGDWDDYDTLPKTLSMPEPVSSHDPVLDCEVTPTRPGKQSNIGKSRRSAYMDGVAPYDGPSEIHVSNGEELAEKPSKSGKRRRSHPNEGVAPYSSPPESRTPLGDPNQPVSIPIEDDAIELIVPFADLRRGIRSMRTGVMLNDIAINTMVYRPRGVHVSTVDTLLLESFGEYFRRTGATPHWVRQNTVASTVSRILVPLYDLKRQHWSLAVGHMKRTRIDVYDPASMSTNLGAINLARKILSTFGLDPSFSTAPLEVLRGPRQENGVDCGVHVIAAARALAESQTLAGPWDIETLRLEYAAQMSTSEYAAPPGFSSHTPSESRIHRESTACPLACQPLHSFLEAQAKYRSRVGYYACALATMHIRRRLAMEELDRLEEGILAIENIQKRRKRQVTNADTPIPSSTGDPLSRNCKEYLVDLKSRLAAQVQRVDCAIAETVSEDVEKERTLESVYPQLLSLKGHLAICHVLGPRFMASKQKLLELQAIQDDFLKKARPYMI